MNKKKSLIRLGLIVGVLILLNVVAYFFYGFYDLTEDKRYSVTEPTQELIKNLDERIFVTVYLEGEFPAGFRRLQGGVKDVLKKFRSLSSKVNYQFIDPNAGEVKEVNALREQLKKMGIAPTNLIVKDGTERKEVLIFPAAVLTYKGRSAPINLLEENRVGVDQEVVLNNSIQQLEFKFANALSILKDSDRKRIFFTAGHGELNRLETADLQKSLSKYHYTGRINLDSIVQINPIIDILVVAKPTQTFSERDKFKIDQYIMNGGKVIWSVDRLGAGLDSLRGGSGHVPIDYPLELDDMFFKYGFRLNTNMVLDLEATPIPLQVGGTQQDPQYEFFDWCYHPKVAPTNVVHPIVKGLDRIDVKFAGSIDTIKTSLGNIQKTVILKSSTQSRAQFAPARVNFEILRYEPDRSKFNKQFNLGLLLEGTFSSHYRNRVPQSMQDTLKIIGSPFRDLSIPTSMIVLSDGDIMRNPIRIQNGQAAPMPLGFNEFARYTFANKDLIFNCVEYLLGKDGLMEARSKELKLRMMNESKVKKERSYWQFINIGLPLILLALFGGIFNYVRMRRYAR